MEKITDSVVVVVGGTDDVCLPLTRALAEINERVDLVHIDPGLDLKTEFRKQIDEDEPIYYEHHRSHFRILYAEHSLLEKISLIIHFGLQGHKVTIKEIETL